MALKGFRQAGDVVQFDAGEIIFAQGDIAEEMYVIRDGTVDLELGHSVVEHLEAGQIFGEMGLIQRHSHNVTAVAKTHVVLIPVDAERFRFLLDNTPYFAHEVMHGLSERLLVLETRFMLGD